MTPLLDMDLAELRTWLVTNPHALTSNEITAILLVILGRLEQKP